MYGWGLGERVHRQCEAVGHVAAHEVAHAEVHAEAHVEVVVVDIFDYRFGLGGIRSRVWRMRC